VVPSIHTNRGTKRARTARTDLGLGLDAPVPDLLEAVEGPGAAHVVVLDLGEGVAGAYLARPGCPLIFVNGRQVSGRRRFTLAHEFGHHRIGHGTVVDSPSDMADYDHDPQEVEANAFAAEFLVPRQAVEAWGARRLRGQPGLDDVVTLAAEYGVSAQMVRYRLETCGVLSDLSLRTKLDEEIAEQLHLKLADDLGLGDLDDGLARAASRLPRIPPTLRSSRFGELLAGELDPEGFAARTGQDPAAVGRMLANLGLDEMVVSA